MAKKLLFSLLFFTFFANLTQAFAKASTECLQGASSPSDICDAPAPDSFRLVNAGTNYVVLAWKPVWTGATHTLVIQNLDQNGGLIHADTVSSVSGSTYTVSNLVYKARYKFTIATNCPNGETSFKTSTFDHITLILDLVLQGRNPTNPTVVPGDCPTINYNAYNWVGFKIQTISGFSPTSTLYEFVTGLDNNEIYPIIKRVNYDGPIMAVGYSPITNEITFPKNSAPVIKILGSTAFDVRHYTTENSYISVGRVIVTLTENPKRVSICIETSVPWNTGYQLSPMIAQQAIGYKLPTNGLQTDEYSKFTSFKVQTPFKDYFNVFVPEIFSSTDFIHVKIVSLNGETISEQHFEGYSDSITIPTENLSTGIYILQIQAMGTVQTLKIVKID